MNIKQVIKEEIQRLTEGYYDNQGIVRLYHRVGSHQENDILDRIRNVMKNGLIPYDSGEIGAVIWLSNNFNDYGDKGDFVVALDFDTATNGYANNKYELLYEGSNAYAYKPIPPEDLIVIKIPAGRVAGQIIPNTEFDELVKDYGFTPERINNGEIERVTIYPDIFNKYVQPYINIPDFISKLDTDKVELINVGI